MFDFLNRVIMILFGLLQIGEENTCPFSLSCRNTHTNTSVGQQSVKLALLQFSFFALCITVYTSYRVLLFFCHFWPIL